MYVWVIVIEIKVFVHTLTQVPTSRKKELGISTQVNACKFFLKTMDGGTSTITNNVTLHTAGAIREPADRSAYSPGKSLD